MPEEADSSSKLHRKVRDEVDGILKGSLMRRLEQLEQKVQQEWRKDLAKGSTDLAAAASSTATSAASRPVSTRCSSETQMEGVEDSAADVRSLSEAVAQALRTAVRCAKPPQKAFGPTKRQEQLLDPPEKVEEIVREVDTLRATLRSLEGTLGNRERQIGALLQQLETCKSMLQECQEEARVATDSLSQLQADPGLLKQTQADRMTRRRARVAALAAKLEWSTSQARHYRALAQQQRAFFLQSERVAVSGGKMAITRHPAGEVALVPQPPTMDDEKPEVWDVGTAIADPYRVDSWPFEPNVLAKRAPQESSMQPFVEETEEDLMEEDRRFRNPFRSGFNLRLPAHGDEDDERYDGPSETSRSL